MKGFTLGSIMSVVLALAVPAAAASLPKALQVGGERLTLSGHGTRNELLFVELYAVGLYLPQRMSDAQAISQPKVPKAVRVEIRYDGSLPDRIPAGWRSELMPALTKDQQETLVRHYQQLKPGDTITISYTPDSGTRVAVSDREILQDNGHEVMKAFLDVWIGRQPVSEDLKQSLL